MDYRQLLAGVVIGLMLGVGVTTVMAQSGDKNDKTELVVSEGLAATRSAPNGKAQITILAEGDKAFMGKLRVKANASLPKHKDSTEEYLYVLNGTGKLTINGTQYNLEPDQGVFIPAGATVSYKNNGELFEAIQIFAGPEPANKYSKWETGASAWKPKSRMQMQKGKSGSGGGGPSGTIDM